MYLLCSGWVMSLPGTPVMAAKPSMRQMDIVYGMCKQYFLSWIEHFSIRSPNPKSLNHRWLFRVYDYSAQRVWYAFLVMAEWISFFQSLQDLLQRVNRAKMDDKLQEVVWQLRKHHQPDGIVDSLTTAIVFIGRLVTSEGLFKTDGMVILCKGLVHFQTGAKYIFSEKDERGQWLVSVVHLCCAKQRNSLQMGNDDCLKVISFEESGKSQICTLF